MEKKPLAKILALLNQKGGVGKTTSTINLSTCFADAGKRVLAIDLDPQANMTKVLSGGRYEFDKTAADLFGNPKCKIDQVIIQAVASEQPIENLYIVPSHISLSRVIEQSLTRVHREKILARQLSQVADQFDVILLDCPPNLSLTSTNAMLAADLFLIPVDGGAFALDGLADLLDALAEVKESDDFAYAVFRNEVADANKLINEFLGEQLAELGDNLLATAIRRAEHIGQASVTSQPLNRYKPGSRAMPDYNRLAKEVASRLGM